MPVESPILDDLDFKGLETYLRSQIPLYAPEWTDHNDSDPGITLIQLFSHLAEQIAYRLNQVPEKNYIEFLKMLGIQLLPAKPAQTTMNFVLTRPEKVEQFLLPLGSRIKAKSNAEEPPVFETDVNLDVVPAQLATLVTTHTNQLLNINPDEPGPGLSDPQQYIDARYQLAWDGKTPKLKDMPMNPVALFSQSGGLVHNDLWIGLAFNPAITAGFLGARVSLKVQLDDDEQPVADAFSQCGEADFELSSDPLVEEPLASYRYYRPPQGGEPSGSWQTLNILGDSTEGWTRSGVIRFDVPARMGAIADKEWQDVEAGLPHPLIGALKNPVEGTPNNVPISGWIHVHLPTAPNLLLRMLSFNTVAATSAETVRNEQLGRGNAKPGQRLQLANDNVLRDSLDIISVGPAPHNEQRQWQRLDNLYSADPFVRVYMLDAEAGEIVFGDGVYGRPPEENERLIALSYRHGGGESAEVAVGLVNQPESLPAKVEAAHNIVAARGGKDAETLEQAKRRAAQEQKTQRRAVTVEDFEFHTLQTPGVRVQRAVIVPLHIPYPPASDLGPGLDLETRVPGAVSIIVIPDEEGLYPVPTEGMLRTVCRYLDNYRLITTEVYVTVPQYLRLYDFTIEIRAARGYSRTQLREAIAAHLENYFHVLRGGANGEGYPFGVTLHHADLVAQVFQVDGVDRVEALEAMYDGRTPEAAFPEMYWRDERQTPRRLTNCAESAQDDEKIVLQADETVFIDSSTLDIRITEG